MEIFSSIYVDFWGTKFERRLFCRLLSSMLECSDEDNEGWYDFSYNEGEDYVSIHPGYDNMFEDNDIVDRGVNIANVFAAVFPHSHFVYFANLDYTYNGSGWNTIMIKYDGINLIVFGPENRIETKLFDDNATGESEYIGFNPKVVRAIKNKIESGKNVFGIKYYQQYECDGNYTAIMDFLWEIFPPIAIEYVTSPTIIYPDLDKKLTRTSYFYPYRKKEMDPKMLMLQAMEEQLCSGEDSGRASEYLEFLPEEMITFVLNRRDAEMYPHALAELQNELGRRKHFAATGRRKMHDEY